MVMGLLRTYRALALGLMATFAISLSASAQDLTQYLDLTTDEFTGREVERTVHLAPAHHQRTARGGSLDESEDLGEGKQVECARKQRERLQMGFAPMCRHFQPRD